ncbi:helix-turn-helix transcriptional regulator [Pantoea coffeiphila]|uniref:Transcriptional regulator n=1 Tax=Pantoea coffeiphila TaxID=1465635 RepID=A0A2S9I9C2_9GAMM|nr:helix-turn-helix transcriptional regulator [Pantoea coffeiphila]PRD14371.1 transcriptional regulator [Pantoea coffeiphila]
MSEIQLPASTAQKNRQLLATFLRSRRENLDPIRLGMPHHRPRRTPGLRREEVAQLADVGVTWYTWLEQGREINVSAKTLSAIATALQCNEAETQHLFQLAGHASPASVAAKTCATVSAHGQILLDSLNPLPAIIQSLHFDIIGYNPAWCRLMNVELETIPQSDRNCILLAFTHPQWRAAIADQDVLMPHMVALFRTQMADHLDDPRWQVLLERLMAESEEFRDLWPRYEIRAIDNQVKRFYHPRTGMMTLRQNNWWSAPRNGDRLLVYIPNDEESAAALRSITD